MSGWMMAFTTLRAACSASAAQAQHGGVSMPVRSHAAARFTHVTLSASQPRRPSRSAPATSRRGRAASAHAGATWSASLLSQGARLHCLSQRSLSGERCAHVHHVEDAAHALRVCALLIRRRVVHVAPALPQPRGRGSAGRAVAAAGALLQAATVTSGRANERRTRSGAARVSDRVRRLRWARTQPPRPFPSCRRRPPRWRSARCTRRRRARAPRCRAERKRCNAAPRQLHGRAARPGGRRHACAQLPAAPVRHTSAAGVAHAARGVAMTPLLFAAPRGTAVARRSGARA